MQFLVDSWELRCNYLPSWSQYNFFPELSKFSDNFPSLMRSTNHYFYPLKFPWIIVSCACCRWETSKLLCRTFPEITRGLAKCQANCSGIWPVTAASPVWNCTWNSYMANVQLLLHLANAYLLTRCCKCWSKYDSCTVNQHNQGWKYTTYRSGIINLLLIWKFKLF